MLNEKFWKKYFKIYDILNIVPSYQDLLIQIEKELELNSDDILLDVGSGTGNFSVIAKKKCKNIVAIDYSMEGIKRHKEKDSNTKIILHDITKTFPFPDNYFSKIVSNNTIYTLTEEQQIKTLTEIFRVLKKNGKFVISNVKKNYDPKKIYYDAIFKNTKEKGIFNTLILFFETIIPSIKMFYYNNKIKKSGLEKKYNFLDEEGQKMLLSKTGFKKISSSRRVYAGQAILNSAYKI